MPLLPLRSTSSLRPASKAALGDVASYDCLLTAASQALTHCRADERQFNAERMTARACTAPALLTHPAAREKQWRLPIAASGGTSSFSLAFCGLPGAFRELQSVAPPSAGGPMLRNQSRFACQTTPLCSFVGVRWCSMCRRLRQLMQSCRGKLVEPEAAEWCGPHFEPSKPY